MTRKEEIIKTCYEAKYTSPKYMNSVNRVSNFEYISPAMDEYARQEAVGFVKWCGQNSTMYECDEDLWHHKTHEGHKYSSEIMHSLYIQSKQNA